MLTAYQLACGYIQTAERRPDVVIKLWHEHGCYHVRGHDFVEHKRLFWNSYRTLSEARRAFRQATQS